MTKGSRNKSTHPAVCPNAIPLLRHSRHKLLLYHRETITSVVLIIPLPLRSLSFGMCTLVCTCNGRIFSSLPLSFSPMFASSFDIGPLLVELGCLYILLSPAPGAPPTTVTPYPCLLSVDREGS